VRGSFHTGGIDPCDNKSSCRTNDHQQSREIMFRSYSYADIGHASVAKSKAFYILSELNNRANGFVTGYELLEGKMRPRE